MDDNVDEPKHQNDANISYEQSQNQRHPSQSTNRRLSLTDLPKLLLSSLRRVSRSNDSEHKRDERNPSKGSINDNGDSGEGGFDAETALAATTADFEGSSQSDSLQVPVPPKGCLKRPMSVDPASATIMNDPLIVKAPPLRAQPISSPRCSAQGHYDVQRHLPALFLSQSIHPLATVDENVDPDPIQIPKGGISGNSGLTLIEDRADDFAVAPHFTPGIQPNICRDQGGRRPQGMVYGAEAKAQVIQSHSSMRPGHWEHPPSPVLGKQISQCYECQATHGGKNTMKHGQSTLDLKHAVPCHFPDGTGGARNDDNPAAMSAYGTGDETCQKSITFKDTVEVIPTYRKSEYNRRSDKNATYKILTPDMKSEIRDELNSYKLKEMAVHAQSMRNTAFH